MSVLGPQDAGLEGVVLAGRYRIEKRLGAGGMGEVYRAINTVIDRPVAIKVLHRELTRNPEIVARFLREAKAAIIVRHPNVVDVLDVLEHDGVPFIVQELLHGNDLSKYLDVAGGKLGVDEALPLLIPVVEAVGLAHSKGVIHRDLKPENVFLHEVEGLVIPKVLDFGISKVTDPSGARMTSTGTAMGTPAYMSPEQIQGSADVDARGDVWSWGVVLFEVLSGRLPFEAETSGALFVQICTTHARRLNTVVSDVPASVVEIVARCLEPNREKRFANGTELAKALRAVMAERGVESTNKLQAIGPAVIEALASSGALGSADAAAASEPEPSSAAKTKVSARGAAVSKKTARATPSALADERSDVEHTSEEQRDAAPKRGRSTAMLASAGAVFVGVISIAAVMTMRSGNEGTAVTTATDAAALTSAVDAQLVAAHELLHQSRDPVDAGVSATTVAENPAQDAAVLAVTEDASAALVASGQAEPRAQGHHQHARRDASARATATAQATQTSTTTSASAAHGTQGTNATVTATGRQTHAATTYEP